MRENFQNENKTIREVVNTIEKKLIDTMRSNGKTLWNLASEQNKDFDRIYTYDYNGFDSSVREMRVIALYLLDNEIYVISTDQTTYAFYQTWTDEQIYEYINVDSEPYEDFSYEPLFGGNILGYFTAMNIAEFIDEYYL